MKKIIVYIIIVAVCTLSLMSQSSGPTISYTQMEKLLGTLKSSDSLEVTVTIEGHSSGNRSLYLVRLLHPKEAIKDKWKVFFAAQQHGNEIAGKDALLNIIRDIVRKPSLLPPGVELWVAPMVNPDGAEANKRRNGNDFDLNRDHTLLSQPEIQTLHRVFRRIMPHVFVDCHEFGRNSEDYREKGWLEWPQIMMDCSNNPFFHPKLYEAGLRWIENAAPIMKQEGHNYTRYILGGTPIDGELRHSATDIDDGRNGLGAYQGLSFIIESGDMENAPDPALDLQKRVAAYTTLLTTFLHPGKNRKTDMEIVEKARKAPVPAFIPTNCFWANTWQKITPVNVIEAATGKTIVIPTANYMNDMTVKQSAPTPLGYIIDASCSVEFKTLLDRHALPYTVLDKPQTYTVENCKSIRIENDFDEVYSRYGGRQIVSRLKPEEKTFPEGSIWVPIQSGSDGIRAALLLEPTMLYGLFQYPVFQKLVKEGEIMPIRRVIR